LEQDRGATHPISHPQGTVNKLCHESSQAKQEKFPVKCEGLLLVGMEKFPDKPDDEHQLEGQDDESDMPEFKSFHVCKDGLSLSAFTLMIVNKP
jgi:hypothetical protein